MSKAVKQQDLPILTRKSPREKINGWLIIDKPEGMSSAQVVAVVKGITRAEKVGHAGTLDPLASGVLPIALGEATKTVSYAMDHRKAYLFTVTFGEARSTDDREGEVIATSTHCPTREAIEGILPSFTGRITQIPPIYSAIKVDGARAYALARAGKVVDMPAREVEIDTLTLLAISESPCSATFRVECSKGTYVRALARDIAEALETCGYVSYLRRISVGNFSEEHAILLDKLRDIMHNHALQKVLLSVGKVLDDIPALIVSPDIALALKNGQTVSISPQSTVETDQAMVRIMTEDHQLLALGSYVSGRCKPIRVFNI